MANALYDLGRQAFLEGSIAYLTDTIKVVLVQTGGGHYVVNTATDQFLSIIAAGDRIATQTLGTKTSTAGVADAADVTFPLVAAGVADGALVLYKDTGNAATSPLIAYIDTATGLPVTPGGGDVVIVWDNTASLKIFKL